MKSILITGASSGIGRSTAEIFATNGWRVGALARRLEPLSDLAAKAANITPLIADVTDYSALGAAFTRFCADGPLDVLFNNAGIFTPPGSIDEISLSDWHRAVDTNLTGMFYAARAAFAQMRAQRPQGGRIINNGSISAHVPRPGSAPYTATKHAITGLTRTISLDGRPYDIACGQIDIGNAETPMVQELNARAADPQPVMDVAEAARAVFHMASLPLGANVQFMTVMATKMPYIGRG